MLVIGERGAVVRVEVCCGRAGGREAGRVHTARATLGLKPPSSRVCWLSESREPSYELEYAAEGPGGGRLVEFMPLSYCKGMRNTTQTERTLLSEVSRSAFIQLAS
jgi:hypothetical protein